MKFNLSSSISLSAFSPKWQVVFLLFLWISAPQEHFIHGPVPIILLPQPVHTFGDGARFFANSLLLQKELFYKSILALFQKHVNDLFQRLGYLDQV